MTGRESIETWEVSISEERDALQREREGCLCQREMETAREDPFLSRWLPRRVVIPQDLSCSSLERRGSKGARLPPGRARRTLPHARIEALWGVCERDT